MQITEVRIKLMEDPGERLKAFCSVTFDNCFVVRDLKIIEGTSGPFVAMPSRKLTSHCPNAVQRITCALSTATTVVMRSLRSAPPTTWKVGPSSMPTSLTPSTQPVER